MLRWELEPDGAGTRLTSHHLVESPDWIPSVAADWHLCLAVAERPLDGETVPRIAGSRAKEYGWQERHDAYAASTGIASTGRPVDAGRRLDRCPPRPVSRGPEAAGGARSPRGILATTPGSRSSCVGS